MLGCALDSLNILGDGDIFSIGQYVPKHAYGHWDSSWSQIILKAKKDDAWVIIVLGQILAAHLEYWLSRERQYLMTYVPGKNGIMRHIAFDICSRLNGNNRYSVCAKTLLAENRTRKKSQHRCITISDRLRNVRGHYQITSTGIVNGQNIIVFDDIITSGATMVECCRLLKRAGARSVAGIALARTVKTTS